MLVEFRVTNFRSIRDTQVFSMVAAKDSALRQSNCMDSGLSAAPQLIRSAVLYGPNAGGKSNLILAINHMRWLVEQSAVGVREGQKYDRILPFRLDKKSAGKPTEFEITFIEGGIRYQYGFALTAERIEQEWLLVYKSKKSQCWFNRIFDKKNGKYKWHYGSHLKSSNGQRALWEESTRTNALFLSTAVNLNSEQLRPIYNWFVNKLIVVIGSLPMNVNATVTHIRDGKDKIKVIEFLQAADLAIVDVQVNIQKSWVQIEIKSGEKEPVISPKQELEFQQVTFFHNSINAGLIGFDLTDESHGTQRLFAYIGLILDVLQNGSIFVVDELDTSLHPQMLRFLLGIFHNTKLNSKNAQLIFTSHDASLLNKDIFRRDQVWFIEKDREQASHLYPLTDFSPRKDEALEKGYLMGRYGALPFFGDLKL